MSEAPSVHSVLSEALDLINLISKKKILSAATKNAGGNKLIRPTPTRWYCTCACINSLLSLKSILKEFRSCEDGEDI